MYYKPDKNHQLYKTFIKYLEDIYRRGVDRFKTFICIGSTFIGKSVFFSKFVIPEEYYIYHSNYLEYSKMPNQPNKIFRILDDINWDQVTTTELKSLMNRNISSVNIKYGYEYIFPLIPVIIMNGEDYKIFRKHFSDIWTFIERNAIIYPPQDGKEVTEEKVPLFTNEPIRDYSNRNYLFNEIIDIEQLKECNMNNMNEWIKQELNKTESWKYDTTRYVPFPERSNIKIPNPELNKNTILKEYEEYMLRKKVKEMNNEGKEEEKKPREPWYQRYYQPKQQKRSNKSKFEDLECLSDEDDETYDEKDKDNDDYEDDEDMSETVEEDDEDDGSSVNFGKDFVEL